MPVEGAEANLAEAATTRAGARRSGLLLGLLLLGTLLKGVVWSQLIFPLDAPDEPSHFNYVMQVHSFHKLPQVFISGPGHLDRPSTGQDSQTRDMLDYFGFTEFRGMPYESSQPPLYYVGVALLIAPLDENRLLLLYAARLVSVLLGVGAVCSLWFGLRALWPGVPLVVWGIPFALTLLPQFAFVTSTVTNDAATVFFGALLFAVWAYGLRAAQERKVRPLLWGLAAGLVTALGLLCKLTMVVTLPGTLLWLWWLTSADPHSTPESPVSKRVRPFLVSVLALGAPLLVIVGWWVVRNLFVYGEPTGTRAIFGLYHRIYWTRLGFPPDQIFSAFPPGDFATRTFQSFWAAYSWTGLTLPWWTYASALALSIVALAGLVRAWLLRRPKQPSHDEEAPALPLSQARRRIVWLSAGTLVLAFVNLLFYDSFVDYQPQARYLFVAVAPALVLLVLGLLRATPRLAVNKALVWALLALLFVMQIMSVASLLGQWTRMAGEL